MTLYPLWRVIGWNIWKDSGRRSNKCMQCDNYSSHQAGHLRNYLKCTKEKIFVLDCVTMHPHQPNNFNQCDSAYSQAESFEKTFEINSRENVDKLQKMRKWTKCHRRLLIMCVNWMNRVNWINWMNFVNWLNKINWMYWVNWMNWLN